jgi:outer membrane receptor for ferric coprogen and ferric-rhodotorulic acid
VGGPLTADGRVRGRAVGAWEDKHSNLDNYQRTSKVGYAVLEADLGERTLLSVGGDVMDSDPKGSTWGGIPLLDSAGNFNRMPRSFNNGARWVAGAVRAYRFRHVGAHLRQRLDGQAAAQPPGQRL